METWSIHQLVQQAEQLLGQEKTEDLARYAQQLISKDVAVVFTLAHLAEIVGVNYEMLQETVNRVRETSNYRMYAIRKRSGGRRFIHAVCADLFSVQQFINRDILQKRAPHPSSFAFHPSGGIRKCAAQHCGAKWIFQFDLRDFFYDVDESDCYRIFRGLGYTKLLSFEFSRLCTTTHLPKGNKRRLHDAQRQYFGYSRSSKRCHVPDRFFPYTLLRQYDLLGVLAQGAPTSPMLSNLAAHKLDVSLHSYAVQHSFVYTRYADDITISAARLPHSMKPGDVCRKVLGRIRLAGFRENSRKMRIAGPGSKKVVLGLLVDGLRPRISKETYRRIDRHLHACRRYGLIATSAHEGFDSAYGFHNHLSGLIAFVKDVDPVRWQDFILRFEQIPIPWKQTAA